MNEKKYLNKIEIQEESKYILKEFIEFLDKNNINYYIIYGTLLGAVRHKGFIPWDDDIDIVISRPDYNRLIEILKKDVKINRSIKAIGWELSNSYWPFIKIVNEKIFLEKEVPFEKNLWIDIFPLDGLPVKNQHKYFKKILLYRNILFRFKLYDVAKVKNHSSTKFRQFMRTIIQLLLKPINYNKLMTKYINFCTKYKYEDSEYVFCNVWDENENGSIKKELLLENAKYEFEGLMVNSIKDADTFLKNYYGEDYMQLPPEEKRISHNFKAWRV